MGGADRLSLSVGFQKFAGSIYAPRATLAYVGDTIIEGGLFANDVVGIGQLKIAAAHPPTPPSTTCDPTPTPGNSPSTPPGSGGGSSTTGGPSTPGVTATPPIM